MWCEGSIWWGFEKREEKDGHGKPPPPSTLFWRRRRQNILHPKTWPGVLLYSRLLPSSKLSDPRILAKFELKPGRTYFSADLGLGRNNTTHWKQDKCVVLTYTFYQILYESRKKCSEVLYWITSGKSPLHIPLTFWESPKMCFFLLIQEKSGGCKNIVSKIWISIK